MNRKMATTKIWAIKTNLNTLVKYVSDENKTENKDFDNLKAVLNYAGNDLKTEQKHFVTGINCNAETAFKSMTASQKRSTKSIKVLGYHAYQSFKSGEVTPGQAHDIGIKLATELWGEKFQVVVATHQNTDNIHNHFVFSSTSFIDGKRYHACKDSYKKMREVSDRLCMEQSISVIENPIPGKSMHYTEHRAEIEGKMTWRGLIREDIDRAISGSSSTKMFWDLMEQMGYELKMNVKYPAVKPPGHQRYFRLYKLGENYTPDKIRERIIKNRTIELAIPESKTKRNYRFQEKFHINHKIKGFRALYLFYSYKLGILPKKRNSNKRMHFLLKEDLLKMDKIITQSKLLFKNKIDTVEQLDGYKDKISQQIKVLTEKKKEIRVNIKILNRGEISVDIREESEKKSDIKNEFISEKGKTDELTSISKDIKTLKRELKLCDEIKERSQEMSEKLKIISEFERKNGKEKKGNDEHSR